MRFEDFGPDAHLRFRQWLEAEYKTIDALNESWGNDFWSGTYSTFDQINIPKRRQWGINLHQRLDHQRFINDETSTFLDEQATPFASISPPTNGLLQLISPCTI